MKKIPAFILSLAVFLFAENMFNFTEEDAEYDQEQTETNQLNINFNDGFESDVYDFDSTILHFEENDDPQSDKILNINFKDGSSSEIPLEEILNIYPFSMEDFYEDAGSFGIFQSGPILIIAYPEIVQAYTVWDTPDSLMLHTVPLKNYYHENGSYYFSPPGNYVCEQMNLKCDTLEYKKENNTWVRIERTVSGLHPCEFQNMDIYRDSTMVVLVPPYSPFFWGAGRYWTSFPINTTRGVVDYNVTIVSATSSQVEINVTTRWIPDDSPQSLNISIGTKKVFDQKANIMVYVRGIDLPNNAVHVTIVRESSTKYRAVCKIPTLRRVPLKSASPCGVCDDSLDLDL